jgi:cytochrome c5
VLNKLLASCLTASALLVSSQTMAAPEPGFPAVSPPPVADAKGQALFKERCSICHDQKESRAPATAYLSTRL